MLLPLRSKVSDRMTYGEMAAVYDVLMKDVPYEDWVSFTLNYSSGHKILDMGCGTGEIAIRLAEKGYQITGVDFSEDMLAIAHDKARTSADIQWLKQDIRQLEGLENFDTVVSFFDVLNYITSLEELRAVFQQTHSVLKPGGTFLFDVHSLNHLKEHMSGQTFSEVYEDITYIWFCEPGEIPDTFIHDLTFFVQNSRGDYSRFDEYHTQRGYTIDVLKEELHRAGFEIKDIAADLERNPVLHDTDGDRIFFICTRK